MDLLTALSISWTVFYMGTPFSLSARIVRQDIWVKSVNRIQRAHHLGLVLRLRYHMVQQENLVDVSELLKKKPVIFHGKTYVSKEVHDQIIEPTENKYAMIDSPEQRLMELVLPGEYWRICGHSLPPPRAYHETFYLLSSHSGGWPPFQDEKWTELFRRGWSTYYNDGGWAIINELKWIRQHRAP